MSLDPALAAHTPPEYSSGTMRTRTGPRRISAGLLVGAMGWVVPFTGLSAVLLPARIAQIVPDDKVATLALLTVAGSIAALLANIVFGALSDLTRTRFGSRTPWIVGGGVAAAGAAVLLSLADSVPNLLLWWCLFQALINAEIASLVAIVPDRVSANRRGTVSTFYGFGLLIGTAIGNIVSAQFLDDPATAMRIVAIFAAVLPIVAVLVAPDLSNADQPRPRMTRSQALQSFSFPPLRTSRDFYWALIGRLLLVVGYFMVSSYQFYILTDYIGLDTKGTAAVLSGSALLTLVGAVIGAVIAGPLSDRIGRRKVPIFAASVLFAIAILIPLLWPSGAGMLAFAAIGGIGYGAYFSVDAALMTEVLPSSQTRGKDLGILNVANTAGQAIAPAASAAIIGIGIGFPPVFIVAVLGCLVGAAAIWPIRSVR